jgi:hypothetical protein
MINRKTGLRTRNASSAISASHTNRLASSRFNREDRPEKRMTRSSSVLSVNLFAPSATYTPNVSRHCLMTSGTPLVISATLGRIVFKSLADFAPLAAETSGLIVSLK